MRKLVSERELSVAIDVLRRVRGRDTRLQRMVQIIQDSGNSPMLQGVRVSQAVPDG